MKVGGWSDLEGFNGFFSTGKIVVEGDFTTKADEPSTDDLTEVSFKDLSSVMAKTRGLIGGAGDTLASTTPTPPYENLANITERLYNQRTEGPEVRQCQPSGICLCI